MQIRKLLAAVTLIAATIGVVRYTTSYQKWKRAELVRVRAGGTLIETRVGPVEYSLRGQGPAVLLVHGTPGGYDQGLALASLLDSQAMTLIAVSRPGYLCTPLSSGSTPEAQADMYAALLDALGIQQAALLAISGGGPSALQFAIRHADRCSKLVMISGVAQRYAEQMWPLPKRIYRRVADRLTVFGPLIFMLLPLTRFVPDASAAADLLHATTLYHLRVAGYKNDLAQFAKLNSYPLEEIAVPTIAVHGTGDGDVPFADAQLLASKIPNLQLLVIEGGNHAAFYVHAASIMPTVRAFLETPFSGGFNHPPTPPNR